jgi:hypothetical protein
MVRTKAPAIPLLCGLAITVVLGSRPMSRAKLRVVPAMWQLSLSESYSMMTGPAIDPAEPTLDSSHHQVISPVRIITTNTRWHGRCMMNWRFSCAEKMARKTS